MMLPSAKVPSSQIVDRKIIIIFSKANLNIQVLCKVSNLFLMARFLEHWNDVLLN